MIGLKGYLVEVKDIDPKEEDQMFSLMVNYYDGISKINFQKDLREKKWVILLKDKMSQEINGFSTYTLLDEVIIDGIKAQAIFSGDTIIDRSHWGCWELFKLFGRLSFDLHIKYKDNNVMLYWFLISKGYKTYRLLPGFFKKFYPCYYEDAPLFERKVLDSFAKQKYPIQYNNQTSIIHFSEPHDRLKEGIADVTAERLKNKHVDFFCRINSLYKYGDELACIAEFSEGNLKPAALKMIFG